MKRIASGAAALAAALTATAALAEEPFGMNVWLASPQLCQEAKAAGSLQKILDDGNLVLTAKGLRGADFRCGFVQVLKAPDIDAWVATALCRQDAAGDFPNVYSISRGSNGKLTLVTVYDDEEPTADPTEGEGSDAAQDDSAAPPAPSQPDAAPLAQSSPNDAASSAAVPDTGEAVGVGDVYTRCEGVAAP